MLYFLVCLLDFEFIYYIPFFQSNTKQLAFFKHIDLCIERKQLSLQQLNTKTYYLQIRLRQTFLFFNILQQYALHFRHFEVFIKILKLCHIIDIVAPWEKDIWIFANRRKVSYISAETKFGCDGLILLEMVDILRVQ